MRIAIVLNTSWNIYNFRMGLIQKLLEEGHEVHVIAPKDEYSCKLIEAGCIYHKVRMDSRGANPIKDAALIAELFLIYKKVKPVTILHFTIKPNVYGSIAAALLNIPVVNNVCGLGTVFLKQNIISRIAEILYKVSFRTPRKVYFQNAHDKELFINRNLIRKEKTDILPGSGINLNHFLPKAFHRNKEFSFLMMSRLIYDKGVTEYIEAARLLREEGIDAKFKILGAIDEKHKRGIKADIIQEWIDEGVIEYLGTTEDVRGYISSADCIVLPSYREGTPRTLLEAASSAKPIVTTDVPGCNNVVENGFNGYLCKMKDARDLADKMKLILMQNDSVLETFGRNGRQKMESQFSEDLVISSYIKTVNEILPLKTAI
ncbi:MAG: glycosyltransferase family 4 protein [Candidatus Cyclobacteriaceae bacterium M2_1C_046]